MWDEELANGAQVHAQQCLFAHDTCRDVSKYIHCISAYSNVKIEFELDLNFEGRFQVGQNIYIFMSSIATTTPDWGTVINSWYNEVTSVAPSSISNFEYLNKTKTFFCT